MHLVNAFVERCREVEVTRIEQDFQVGIHLHGIGEILHDIEPLLGRGGSTALAGLLMQAAPGHENRNT